MAEKTPEAPAAYGGERIESIFYALSQFRTQGFSAPDPLQPGMIRDWCVLTGRRISADELRVIFAMDAAFLASCRREALASDKRGEEG